MFPCIPANLRTEFSSINTAYTTLSFTKHSFDLRRLKVYSSELLFLQAESNQGVTVEYPTIWSYTPEKAGYMDT